VAVNTRERILAAALACVSERGLSATSLDEIRVRAAVSTGSMYHHFPTGKEGVLADLHLAAIRQFQQAVLAELSARRTPGAVVKAVARRQLNWVADNQELGELLVGGVAGARRREDPERAALNERFFGALAGWLEARMRDGSVRTMPAAVALAIWLGPAVMLARQHLAGELDDAVDSVARSAAEAVWNALRGE
jgi:AcrR family transcriptional regulator